MTEAFGHKFCCCCYLSRARRRETGHSLRLCISPSTRMHRACMEMSITMHALPQSDGRMDGQKVCFIWHHVCKRGCVAQFTWPFVRILFSQLCHAIGQPAHTLPSTMHFLIFNRMSNSTEKSNKSVHWTPDSTFNRQNENSSNCSVSFNRELCLRVCVGDGHFKALKPRLWHPNYSWWNYFTCPIHANQFLISKTISDKVPHPSFHLVLSFSVSFPLLRSCSFAIWT